METLIVFIFDTYIKLFTFSFINPNESNIEK